jgi:serine/threonine protein kinase
MALPIVDVRDYYVENLIRRQGEVQISNGRHLQTNERVTVRRLQFSTNLGLIARSLAIQAQLQGPGIAKLLGFRYVPVEEYPIYWLEPLYQSGTIDQLIREAHIKSFRPQFGPTTISKVIFGLAAIMARLHSLRIIHRDLRPSNVYLNDAGEPELGGFDAARYVGKNDKKLTTGMGAALYMAPELFDDVDPYGFPIDVYAYATILYQFFTDKNTMGGKPPPNQLILMIWVGQDHKRFDRQPEIPECFWDLIAKCWLDDQRERPTFDHIFKLLASSDDFVFPGTDLEQFKEYRDRISRQMTEAPPPNFTDIIAQFRRLGINTESANGVTPRD